MKIKMYKQNKKNCEICNALFLLKLSEVHIGFDGNNYISLIRSGHDVFIQTKWLGCDKYHYDYYGETPCDKNGVISKMKIYHCPYCGADFGKR